MNEIFNEVCRAMQGNKGIICLDTETGGLDCNNNALLSLTLIAPPFYKKNIFFPTKDVVVSDITITDKEGVKSASPLALSINKIDLSKHLNERSFADIDEEIYNDFNGKKFAVLGQNLKFDFGFIQVNLPKTYSYLMRQKIHIELMNLTSLYHFLKGVNTGIGLDSLRVEFGVQSKGTEHSSSTDVEDTLKVYYKIMEYFGTIKKYVDVMKSLVCF